MLAGGPGAVLSHYAAAHLLLLIRGPAPPPEITVPTRAGRRRPGIVIHRVAELHVLDTAAHENIRVKIVPRTRLDIAPSLDPTRLTRACHEAWVRHGTTPRYIEACIARNPTSTEPRRCSERSALRSR